MSTLRWRTPVAAAVPSSGMKYVATAGPSHAGSGYQSQNDTVQVMGRGGELTGVWVRWPNGAESTTPVGSAASEVTIRISDG